MPTRSDDRSTGAMRARPGSLLFLPFPSPAMREVQEKVRRFADASVPVLILGETGTGKDVCAHAIWETSGAGQPFVALNSAAVPETLIESELFGHVRGAFTGAVERREGLMARAHGGILFLDEIAEMSTQTQAKLLRAIETGEYRPVGSDAETRSEFRVLAASSANLDRLVEQGRFRPELMHRLGAVRITLPPLRERPEDVEVLTREVLTRFRARSRSPVPETATGEAVDLLRRGRWPGNVRQLRNVVEAAAALAGDVPALEADHVAAFFPTGEPEMTSAGAFPTLDEALRRAEARVVLAALRHADGNRERAARLLDVSEATFYRKLRALREEGLVPPLTGESAAADSSRE